jgi:hypothetical protein
MRELQLPIYRQQLWQMRRYKLRCRIWLSRMRFGAFRPEMWIWYLHYRMSCIASLFMLKLVYVVSFDSTSRAFTSPHVLAHTLLIWIWLIFVFVNTCSSWWLVGVEWLQLRCAQKSQKIQGSRGRLLCCWSHASERTQWRRKGLRFDALKNIRCLVWVRATRTISR